MRLAVILLTRQRTNAQTEKANFDQQL